MREFSFPLYPKGVRGLAPSNDLSAGLPFLSKSMGVERTPYGVVAAKSVVNPFGGSSPASFPFPQFVDTAGKLFALGSTSVSTIDNSVPLWSTTQLLPRLPDNPQVTNNVVAGEVWHTAEYPGGFFAFNGQCIAFQNDRLGSGLVFVEDVVKIKTGCYHEGRVFCGNITLPPATTTLWSQVFAGIPQAAAMLSEIKANWVLWSSVGQFDFPLWFFYPTTYPTDYAMTKDLVLDRFRRNELGFAPMPYKGEIVGTFPLGDSVLVYLTTGIVRMKPLLTDGAFSYSVLPLGRFGVPYRDWVGGDEKEHFFLLSSGELWTINEEFKPKRLGFADELATATTAGFTFVRDDLNSRMLISGTVKAYSLFEDELYEIPQLVSDAIPVSGALVGAFVEKGATEIVVTTYPFDMQSGAIKTITAITLFGKNYVPGTVEVEVSRNSNGPWTRMEKRPLNREGNVRLQATGLQFRLTFRFPITADLVFENVIVRWQRSDRRFLRGPDVDSSASGTS